MFLFKKKTYLFIIIIALLNFIFPQQNKLFWDGTDWNNISKNLDYNQSLSFNVKKAYLAGVLDGRLYGYLKTWVKNNELADDVFSETVDYLTYRELIRNIDYFYNDPTNNYIPIPSAVIIANLYAERASVQNIDQYINDTKDWINELTLELDTLNYSKMLERKILKHNKKQFNQFE